MKKIFNRSTFSTDYFRERRSLTDEKTGLGRGKCGVRWVLSFSSAR